MCCVCELTQTLKGTNLGTHLFMYGITHQITASSEAQERVRLFWHLLQRAA